MPGKGDYGSANSGDSGQGKFFPGSNEWRAWDEGVQARFAEAASTSNPFSQTGRPAEYKAWLDGWNEANDNNVTTPRMPYIFGVPTGSPP